MRYLAALILGLLFPTAATAKGECKDDKLKFCEDVKKEEVQACLTRHEAELSAECRAKALKKDPGAKERAAKAKTKEEGTKEEGTPAAPN